MIRVRLTMGILTTMNKGLLQSQLLENVVQLTYIKKNGERREMRCTKSNLILNSFEGKTILGFTPPKFGPKYNVDATDNLIVWDLEAKDYRTIAAERVTVNKLVSEEEFYKALRDRSRMMAWFGMN